MRQLHDTLVTMYTTLNEYFGDLHWWPGETPFEIALGAILTQNTNWQNVKIAITQLKHADLLDPFGLYAADEVRIAGLIKSSGYFNIKTKRLKAFLHFLQAEYGGNMGRMFQEDLWPLREKLLDVKGIGKETADSILLYGGGKPVFVVDAYTRRILERHDIITGKWSYEEIQALFMDNLPEDAKLYNQYHALLVNTGKYFCKKKTPECQRCPLAGDMLP